MSAPEQHLQVIMSQYLEVATVHSPRLYAVFHQVFSFSTEVSLHTCRALLIVCLFLEL